MGNLRTSWGERYSAPDRSQQESPFSALNRWCTHLSLGLSFLTQYWRVPLMPGRISRIEDLAAPAFQKFCNFLDFVDFDAHFFQRVAEVAEKAVKMAVVQSLLACTRVRDGNIPAAISVSPAEKHGHKHGLPGVQLLDIRILEKRGKRFVGKHPAVEGFRGRLYGSLPADDVKEFVDHRILAPMGMGDEFAWKKKSVTGFYCSCPSVEVKTDDVPDRVGGGLQATATRSKMEVPG
jgi:hypothetical protein